MATLVSPGVSVTIVDNSFYIPASAPTVPLIFIATRADKKKVDGVTDAPGAKEHSIVRTITSLNSSVDQYGVPNFRVDNAGKPQHGDSRNEYGLFALNQALTILNLAYVVRANIDLADADVITLTAGSSTRTGTGNGTVSAITVNQNTAAEELWTLTATSATNFTVSGFVSGSQAACTVGTPYNNGLVSFTITTGGTAFISGDSFTFTVAAVVTTNPLGNNDTAKRAAIVTALQAEINGNMDVRSELYEYNLILCPGYFETTAALLSLNDAINDEAFVISDSPFTMSPEDTATWSLTTARSANQNVSYYYPHGIDSNLDGATVFCAASGIALKQYAYSDNVSEVWFPPAGFRRGVVTGVTNVGYVSGTLGTATTFVSTPLNQGQRDALYNRSTHNNINPIPFFPGRGIVVFGNATSYSLSSALSSINVVRMLNKIKRDIRKAAAAYLFELNDRITRDSIKSMIDGYLNDVMTRRGVYDFIVICDESNNTPTVIDANQLYVDIAIKPARAVEFIYIPINVVSTGAVISH
jgi:hypothetical protein